MSALAARSFIRSASSLALVVIFATRIAGSAAESPAGSDILTPPAKWAKFVEPDFPFFSSIVDARKLGNGLPADNLTPRGLILNLGNDCWACFDTDLLRMSVIWTGIGISPVSMSQISYHSPGVKAVEGEEHLPQILGKPWIANGIYPGWQASEELSLTDPREPGPDPKEVGRGPLPVAMGRFNAIRLTQHGLIFEYEVAGIAVTESVETRRENNQSEIQRHFRLERVTQPLWLILGRKPLTNADNFEINVTAPSAGGRPLAEKSKGPDGLIMARVNPSDKPVEFRVAMGVGGSVAAWEDPRESVVLSAAHWPETLTTRATLSSAPGAHVVDNIPLPLENPWRRNIRLADIAFYQNGKAAAVTFDGDVWMITGLSGDLEKVQWQRFASGLHEPLGLCVRNDELFVCDRNGIWRLRDTDGNGEADVYELFSNAFGQSAETREYAHGIRPAPDGSFVIAKGGIQMSTLGKHNGSVLRIAADGKSSKTVGYGLRSPFIGVHPKTGLITASDQQGNYVPTTPLHIIRDHQFYGFLSNRLPKEKYPAPIADPLTWIPYPINASGAGQVWLTDARMGPLNDALIHIAYYRPEIFAVLLNQRASRTQAAVVSVTRNLEFSPFNGAVNPIDGQLYVTGFQIFGTAAKQISGLARIRYTGAPSTLPREVLPMDKGVLLRFDVPLDAKQATDAANFSAERWNYARTASYGSPHFKMDGSKGQDSLRPTSAYLSRDGKSIFVGIPHMKPVMQMRLGWALATREGLKVEQNTYFTPYELTPFNPNAEGFESLTVDLTQKASELVSAAPITIEEGQRTAELMGCALCHSADGSTLEKVGPTWRGLFGSEQKLSDGNKIKADEAYIRESIRDPAAKLVRGYEKSETAMPSYEGVISDAQIESLILYIKSLK